MFHILPPQLQHLLPHCLQTTKLCACVLLLVSLFKVHPAGSSLPNSCSQQKLQQACIIHVLPRHKVQWCNARPYTKVNNSVLCLKYVSQWLCRAAHRHSSIRLKELLLINERQSESQSERNSLPQFFKQALPTGLYCLDWGIMGSSIYRF